MVSVVVPIKTSCAYSGIPFFYGSVTSVQVVIQVVARTWLLGGLMELQQIHRRNEHELPNRKETQIKAI